MRIQPFNQGEVGDRELHPSKAVTAVPVEEVKEDSPPFLLNNRAIYLKKDSKKVHDIDDPAWSKLYHTESVSYFFWTSTNFYV